MPCEPQWSTWKNQKGRYKVGFVSSCMAGLRHRHDSLPKSKNGESGEEPSEH